jgi:preprotein translocase subunit SecA
MVLSLDSYDLEANLQDIYDAGVEIDWNTLKVDLSDEPIYYPDENKIVLANGKSFSAKLVENISQNTSNNREPIRKIGRNDRCPCGSGKKYKKCCGNPLMQ